MCYDNTDFIMVDFSEEVLVYIHTDSFMFGKKIMMDDSKYCSSKYPLRSY